MANCLRKYQAIWLKLKKNLEVEIECHPVIWKRVKRGVSKEKDEDLAFKVMNDTDSLFLKIEYNEKTHRGKFLLKQRIGIDNVRQG